MEAKTSEKRNWKTAQNMKLLKPWIFSKSLLRLRMNLCSTDKHLVLAFNLYFVLLLLDLDYPILSISNIMPIEGVDIVTFTCTVNTTYGISNYTWYRNDVEISGQRAQIYQIIKGNRSDAGNYSCNATTTSGLTKRSVATSVIFLCKYQNSLVVYPWRINFSCLLLYAKM